MGNCCSRPKENQSRRSKPNRESRYRLLKLFTRNGRDRNGVAKVDDSYMRNEPERSKAITPLQIHKDGSKGMKSKSKDNLNVEDDDIDIYPVNTNPRNGKTELSEDVAEEIERRASASKQNIVHQLTCERILKGAMNKEIPNLVKIVKIVVASVFEDMAEERLLLEGAVYPELKKFCRKQNYDLHIVDLDIDDDQYKYKDWVDEIKRAHDESTGVGFMVLVGQNLGEKCLPARIQARDFEILLEKLASNHGTLRRQYRLDETGETPYYVLKKKLSKSSDKTAEESASPQVLMEEMERTKFKEKCERPYVFNTLLQAGALGHELSNEVSSALWIERTINKRREALQGENMEDKTELRLIRDVYNKGNGTTLSYEEFVKQDKTKRKKFQQAVLEALKDKLHRAMNHPRVNTLTDENLKEVAQHALRCQESVADIDESREHFVNIQRSISSYLRKNTKTPLVVHGPPGCGKTTAVSMAAKLASSKATDGMTLVVRFLGSTRHSSNLRFLLRSICFQLAWAHGEKTKIIPQDFQSIVKMFHSFLHNASRTKRVCIILDGLDELPKANLFWLPRELPDNVRIVLTALTNGGCFNDLKSLVRDGSHFIDVGDIEKSDARSYVTALYRRYKIEPENELTTRLLNAANKCPNLLYLKLLMHQYNQKIPLVNTIAYAGSHVPNSLKHAIEHYFVTMEKKHGRHVIGRILGYLSASRFGLSERELEEVLSRDRISGQMPSSTLPFPSFQLAMILHDLSPCLSKVYFDGVLVVAWKHLIIRYLAFDRYLSSREDTMTTTYQTLTNYFLNSHPTSSSEDDTLSNIRRVHDLPHYLCKAGNVERLKHLALCNFNFLHTQLKQTCIDYVIECFTAKYCPMDGDLKTLVEALKMSSDALNIDPDQLAPQLIGRLIDLTSSDHLTRLLSEARCSSTNALIPNTGCLNSPGTKLLHTSMELYGPTDLTSDSTFGLSATRNAIALWDVRSAKIIRTVPVDSSVRHVRFCRNNRLFVSNTGRDLQIWETSTFKKIWRLDCPGIIEDITLAGDANDVLIAACGSVVKAWNLRNGKMMSEITNEGMFFDRVAGWREYVACASSKAKHVRVYEIFTASFVSHIKAYEERTENFVDCVLLSSIGDGQVLTTSRSSFEVRVFRLSNGDWLRTLGGDMVNPRLTSDGRYILSTNSKNDISVWNMETGVKITHVFRHPPTSIVTNIVANDLTKLVTLSDNKILRVWDLGKEETIQQELSQEKDDNCIRNVVFIKSKGEQRQAVSRSKVSGDICVWNLSNCKPVRILKGTQADDVLVVDETRAVLRSMGKLALIDLEEGRLIKKLRVAFPSLRSRSRLERRASSLYKRRNLSLRLLQKSGVNSKPRCAQFSDVAIVGQRYVVVLTRKRNELNLISLDDGQLVAKLDSGHKECIETILVSNDGKSMVCSYEKGAAAAWNLQTRRVVGWLRADSGFPKLCQATMTGDGHFLVDAVKIEDCTYIATWDLQKAEVQCKVAIPGATVHAIAASSVSGITVCSYKKEYRNTVMVYALRSGTQLHSLPCGKRQQINSIHLSLDGKRAMTFATGDRTIKLWDTVKKTQIGSFTADNTISDCALSDDGNNVILAIHKASTIASLSFASHRESKEMSVDVANPYFNPENYGAVFEFINILDWDDDTNRMDNTLAEKQ